MPLGRLTEILKENKFGTISNGKRCSMEIMASPSG